MTTEHEDEIDWAALAEEGKKNIRPHAGHFSWESDRIAAEVGVLQEFMTALAETNKAFFREARHRGENNDPPDCDALAADATRIGIEITELVDSRSIKAARLGQYYDWKDWKGVLVPKLEQLIQRKVNPTHIKGGPYSQYALVIFSDEPWLKRDYVERPIAEHSFQPTNLISREFLLYRTIPS